ncbi:hypothetical protein [Bilophila wadsworthia]|uniref:hypothetical protein n=1 Tax=Bilophila wadsworthia TaxID=35833 RepID=UPI00242D3523|nr:hypothetical protein [Bilophila wadsworthia]
MTARDCLALLLAGLLAAWWGYAAGAHHTSERYEAELAAINAAHAEQERARAEAVAAAEKNARERLATEAERGNKLAGELLSKTQQLDAERASVNRRIRDVSEKARRDCAGLSAGWVRLYNEALGLGSGHNAGNEGSAPGGAHDAPGPPGAAGARVQPDALATPEDVLAHVRDYGGYCRKLEAGYRGLADYIKDTP